MTDDNDGDPMTARSGLYPFSFRGGDTALQARQIDGSSYTVISGQMAVIDRFHFGAANACNVTPSGGSAIQISAAVGSPLPSLGFLVLGAGDQIAMGADCECGMNVFTAPADATRVLQTVTAAATYTVAAGKVFYLSHASLVGAITLTGDLSIDSVPIPVGALNGYYYELGTTDAILPTNAQQSRVLKAGQVVASTGGSTLLISGILVNA